MFDALAHQEHDVGVLDGRRTRRRGRLQQWRQRRHGFRCQLEQHDLGHQRMTRGELRSTCKPIERRRGLGTYWTTKNRRVAADGWVWGRQPSSSSRLHKSSIKCYGELIGEWQTCWTRCCMARFTEKQVDTTTLLCARPPAPKTPIMFRAL